MKREDAVATLSAIAQQWLENAEEGLSSRISPMDTDEVLRDKFDDEFEFDLAKRVRDGWRAVECLNSTSA